MIKNSDMPASPQPMVSDVNGEVYSTFDNYGSDQSGLTKREAFAMAAMQGIAGNEYCGSHWSKDTAEAAVCLADALLKELDNEQI